MFTRTRIASLLASLRREGRYLKFWSISVGDTLSQAVGRWIPIWYHGRLRPWTNDANESISGAAHRWRKAGFYVWVEPTINTLFSPFERDHCRKAYTTDLNRAVRLAEDAGMVVLTGKPRGVQ